jgi:hypothetical protein
LIGADSNLALMKTAGDAIQTFPTEEAARASLGGTVPQNRRVLPYSEDMTGTTAANQAEKPKHLSSSNIRRLSTAANCVMRRFFTDRRRQRLSDHF